MELDFEQFHKARISWSKGLQKSVSALCVYLILLSLARYFQISYYGETSADYFNNFYSIAFLISSTPVLLCIVSYLLSRFRQSDLTKVILSQNIEVVKSDLVFELFLTPNHKRGGLWWVPWDALWWGRFRREGKTIWTLNCLDFDMKKLLKSMDRVEYRVTLLPLQFDQQGNPPARTTSLSPDPDDDDL